MKRIGLRFEEWPEADRAGWTAIFRKGHPLDEAGPLSHYREASITSLRNDYSYWLAWLKSAEPALLLEPPLMRITAQRLVAWRDAMAHLAPYSVSNQLQALGTMLRALDRERPNKTEKAVINSAKARAEQLGSERKRGRIVDSGILLEAGLRHFRQHITAIFTNPLAPLHCRDGMMIALLSLMPMRRRPFVGLELGRSLQQTPNGWHVILSEADLKCGEGWESPVPAILVDPLSAYVDVIRPMLGGTAAVRSNHVWLTQQGGPMDGAYFGVRMKELTLRLIRRDTSCHLFRDCAATTLALKSPQMARLIKGLLGHSTDRTATHFYNQATSLEVGRVLAKQVRAIKGRS